MINHTATRAGKKYQRDVMKYLRSRGYDVENLVLTGSQDEGDILLRLPMAGPWPGQRRYVIEAKREKGFHIADWTRQAELERNHYADHREMGHMDVGFLVVHAARGKTIGQSYVTTTLDEWLERL